MIIDASAIVAAIMGEPSAERLGKLIGGAPACRVRAPTLVEATLVLTHKEGPVGKTLLAAFGSGGISTSSPSAVAGEPLLCTGDDFGQTDLELVPLTGS